MQRHIQYSPSCILCFFKYGASARANRSGISKARTSPPTIRCKCLASPGQSPKLTAIPIAPGPQCEAVLSDEPAVGCVCVMSSTSRVCFYVQNLSAGFLAFRYSSNLRPLSKMRVVRGILATLLPFAWGRGIGRRLTMSFRAPCPDCFKLSSWLDPFGLAPFAITDIHSDELADP